jgi:hypothetical protein
MNSYTRTDLLFDIGVFVIAILLIVASSGCSGGQVALVVDGDGNMKQVTCVEYKQPGAKAELLCQ